MTKVARTSPNSAPQSAFPTAQKETKPVKSSTKESAASPKSKDKNAPRNENQILTQCAFSKQTASQKMD